MLWRVAEMDLGISGGGSVASILDHSNSRASHRRKIGVPRKGVDEGLRVERGTVCHRERTGLSTGGRDPLVILAQLKRRSFDGQSRINRASRGRNGVTGTCNYTRS